MNTVGERLINDTSLTSYARIINGVLSFTNPIMLCFDSTNASWGCVPISAVFEALFTFLRSLCLRNYDTSYENNSKDFSFDLCVVSL